MRKLTKVLLTVAALSIVVLNGCYISNKVNDFKKDQKTMVSIMKTGIGAESKNTISGSIYGQHYTATYYVDGNNICREFNWK